MIKLGYKVMRVENGYAIAGADSSQSFKLDQDELVYFAGNGIYLGTTKQYVLDYYSGLAELEVLLTLSYNPKHINTGCLEDKEPEISVTVANLEHWEYIK